MNKTAFVILRVFWILGIIVAFLFAIIGFLHNFVLVNMGATPLMSWMFGPIPMLGGILWATFLIWSFRKLPLWLTYSNRYIPEKRGGGWRFLKFVGYLTTFSSLGLLICMNEVENAVQILYTGLSLVALTSLGMSVIYYANKKLKSI